MPPGAGDRNGLTYYTVMNVMKSSEKPDSPYMGGYSDLKTRPACFRISMTFYDIFGGHLHTASWEIKVTT
jgi:hypothetical protein